MVNPNAHFWQGQEPWRSTGGLADLADFAEWSDGTGFVLTGKVLDIGCGTGRMASLCDDYTGVDITPSFVEYAQGRGLNVSLTVTPDDLPAGPFDRILMASVMTHMGHADRLAYLKAIRLRLAGEALIDILPGFHDSGSLGAWYCDPARFASDLADHGFELVAEMTWTARDGHVHKYHRVR